MSEQAAKTKLGASSRSQTARLISLDDHRRGKSRPDVDKHSQKSAPVQVTFHRSELNAILRVYGFKVAEGEWRDYAIDHLPDRAVFSIFRRASEMPVYRVEKNPKLARKQGQYSVTNLAGQILKRGHDLPQVLKILEKKPRLVKF